MTSLTVNYDVILKVRETLAGTEDGASGTVGKVAVLSMANAKQQLKRT